MKLNGNINLLRYLHKCFKKSFKVLPVSLSSILLVACSFVELNPAATNIILHNDPELCESVEQFNAEVTVTNFFVDRKERAIAEELQILALNKAYELNANAIWPQNEVKDGKQTFNILRCKRK